MELTDIDILTSQQRQINSYEEIINNLAQHILKPPCNLFIDYNDVCEKQIIQKRIEYYIEKTSSEIIKRIQHVACLTRLHEHYSNRSINIPQNRTKYDTKLCKQIDHYNIYKVDKDSFEFAQKNPYNIPTVSYNSKASPYCHSGNIDTFGINCGGIRNQIQSYNNDSQFGHDLLKYIQNVIHEPKDVPNEDWFILVHYYTLDILNQELSKFQKELLDLKIRKKKFVDILKRLIEGSETLLEFMENILTSEYICDDIIMECLFHKIEIPQNNAQQNNSWLTYTMFHKYHT